MKSFIMIFNAKRDLGHVYPSYQYQENQPVCSNIDRVELKSYYCIQYHGALTELTSLTFTQLKEYSRWDEEEFEVAYKDTSNDLTRYSLDRKYSIWAECRVIMS